MKHMIKFLTAKCKTKCPYALANKNDVCIICEPLGNIDGYYNKINNQKFIHVNSDVSEWTKNFVVAYQLYFALNDIEYNFLNIKEYKKDLNAHEFAICLLHKDYNQTRHDYTLVMA